MMLASLLVPVNTFKVNLCNCQRISFMIMLLALHASSSTELLRVLYTCAKLSVEYFLPERSSSLDSPPAAASCPVVLAVQGSFQTVVVAVRDHCPFYTVVILIIRTKNNNFNLRRPDR